MIHKRIHNIVPGIVDRVKIKFGYPNKISIHEEVWAINDYEVTMNIQLANSIEGVEWLLEELDKGKDFDKGLNPDWLDENTFADREAINERYGF